MRSSRNRKASKAGKFLAAWAAAIALSATPMASGAEAGGADSPQVESGQETASPDNSGSEPGEIQSVPGDGGTEPEIAQQASADSPSGATGDIVVAPEPPARAASGLSGEDGKEQAGGTVAAGVGNAGDDVPDSGTGGGTAASASKAGTGKKAAATYEGYKSKKARDKVLSNEKKKLKKSVKSAKSKYSKRSVIPKSGKMMKKLAKLQKAAAKAKTLSEFKAARQKVKKQIAKIKKKYNSLVVNQSKNTRARNHLTASGGVCYYAGRRETYYSQRVLPGGGLNIPGRHVGKYGTVRDKYNYICVAASDLPKGYTYKGSLGWYKVYDSGCDAGTTDVYVDW